MTLDEFKSEMGFLLARVDEALVDEIRSATKAEGDSNVWPGRQFEIKGHIPSREVLISLTARVIPMPSS